MSFNPANFPFTMPALPQAEAADPNLAMAEALHAAACRFEARPQADDFARRSAQAARDIAAKLVQFGGFASEAQKQYADKLVFWSQPKPAPVQQARTTQNAEAVRLMSTMPKLFALMQRLSKLTIGQIQIVRKNQDSLCWIKHEGAEKVVGRLVDGGSLTLWARPGVNQAGLIEALRAIEADPEAAAVLHGRASGRCSVCSRDLTDPESIARGIGPICAEKF
jgi:Family of unknown function (DUF6011)